MFKSRPARATPLLACLAGLVQVFSGCTTITSNVPLYDPKTDRTFDAGLVGRFEQKQDQLRWTFKPGSDASYDIVVEGDLDGDSVEGEQNRYDMTADLVKIGSKKYLFPLSGELCSANENGARCQAATSSEAKGSTTHPMPHFRIKRRGDRLFIRILNQERFDQLLMSGPITLAHERSSPDNSPTRGGEPMIVNITLEAPKEQVRAFLQRHQDDDVLYPLCFDLRRAP